MAKTIRERLSAGLLSRGAQEVKTGKYKVYQTTDNQFYFLGSNGSLRKNKTAGATNSLSLTGGQFYQDLLIDGDNWLVSNKLPKEEKRPKPTRSTYGRGW